MRTNANNIHDSFYDQGNESTIQLLNQTITFCHEILSKVHEE